MPFIPVENTVHTRIEGRVDGQQTINDLYFRHTTGAIAQSDLQTLADAIAAWMTDIYAPLINVAWSGVQVACRDLTTENGFSSFSALTAVVGGVSGEAAPNNCSMAVSFRTAFSGRNFRGRNYVPVLTNADVTGNNIDSAFAANIVATYELLMAGGSDLPAGWTWVVVSKVLNGVPRVAGVFNEIFSVLVTDLVVDSMRRRLPGRGN